MRIYFAAFVTFNPGHQYTKKIIKPDEPEQEPNNEKTHEVYIEMEEIEEKNYSDHTGLIPNTSNRGMNYVMIFIFMMLITLKVSQSKIALKTSSFEHTRKHTPN